MDKSKPDYSEAEGFIWPTADRPPSHGYLLPAVRRVLSAYKPARLFDLGCGNGTLAAALAAEGYEVSGIDPSESGISQANRAFPDLRLEIGSAYDDDLVARFGTFPAVISLEVVEHLYFPHHFARTLAGLLEPGGVAIISTPYHGYLKNLALAVAGAHDRHHHPLRDHGHIKFFSEKTLIALVEDAGLQHAGFQRVGRIPQLAKSMVLTAVKPN